MSIQAKRIRAKLLNVPSIACDAVLSNLLETDDEAGDRTSADPHVRVAWAIRQLVRGQQLDLEDLQRTDRAIAQLGDLGRDDLGIIDEMEEELLDAVLEGA